LKNEAPLQVGKPHSNPSLNFDFENENDAPLRISKRPKLVKDFATSLLI